MELQDPTMSAPQADLDPTLNETPAENPEPITVETTETGITAQDQQAEPLTKEQILLMAEEIAAKDGAEINRDEVSPAETAVLLVAPLRIGSRKSRIH